MDQLFTIIQFIFISNTKNINPSEFQIKFEGEGETHKLDMNNSITLRPEYPQSSIYFCESIKIIYKAKEFLSFQFLIYLNKLNTIFIDLDEVNKPSFELLFYSKEEKYNPSKIRYKDTIYKQFTNYKNKYRSRIFFANADPEKLEYINSENMKKYNFDFQNNNTYHVLLRVINNEKYEISMANMESYFDNINNLIGPKIEISEEDFENLETILCDFLEKYFKLMSLEPIYLKEREIVYSDLENLIKKIHENEAYDLLIRPNVYNYEIFGKRVLYLFNIDFFLRLFKKLTEKKEEFELLKKKAEVYQKMEEELYKKLFNDKNINISQKVQILRTFSIFAAEVLLSSKTILGVSYIDIRTLSENNAYFKSNQMMRKLISEITEDSRLFEAFMYFDSDIIQNILIENKQEKLLYQDIFEKNIEDQQPEYITEYGMSLMTVEEVRDHLLDLLPTIIVQIDTNVNIRALFERETNLMVINGFKMFGLQINEIGNLFETDGDYYVVPISMEVFHEILGHGKIRYNKEVYYSPLAIRDSKKNFKFLKLMKRVKLDFNTERIINKGETGRVLEYYISENREIIEKLKKRTTNIQINNIKYWVKKDFNLLYKALNYNEEKENLSKNSGELIFDDEEYESEAFYDFVIHH